LVNDLDTIAGPTEGDGQVGQGILPGGRFLVVEHLLGVGLADIDNGFTGQMVIADLGDA
jgi:hypothetical protein